MKNQKLRNKRISVFIFARGGSKSIKNKNLKKLAGISLVEHSIKLATKIKLINHIYLSTDSEKIINSVKKYNIKIIKRPKKLATDTSNEFDAWKHAIKFAEKNNDNFEIFISLPPTAPLRKFKDIENCINLLSDKTDIVLTSYKSNHNPWFNMVSINKNNEARLISKIDNFIPNRQKYNNIYNLATVAYVAKKNYIKNSLNVFQGRVKSLVLPKERSIDIDDPIDLIIAKKLLEK